VDPQQLIDRALKADAERYRHETEAKAAKAEAQKLQAAMAELEKDPWGYLTKRGVTPEMLVERAAVGKAAPSEEVLELRRMVADLAQRIDSTTKQTEAERVHARRLSLASEARQFVSASKDADADAALVLMDALVGGPGLDLSGRVADIEEASNGRPLTPGDVGAIMRGELAERARRWKADPKVRQAFATLFGAAAPASDGSPAPAGSPQAGASLTSQVEQGTGSVVDTSKMSREELIEYYAKKHGA
jgi:hypothetical protein